MRMKQLRWRRRRGNHAVIAESKLLNATVIGFHVPEAVLRTSSSTSYTHSDKDPAFIGIRDVEFDNISALSIDGFAKR